ncbi:MAG TPA: hypothetical protein VKG23_07000, partial [Thermoanaerobaculia bacterium]|nr:hypothetical protein [Thermoanaerobaculia bacterium]
RIAEHGTIPSPIALRPAAVDARDQLDAMEDWNRAGSEPPRTGFTRPLPNGVSARFGRAANADSHSVQARSAGGVTLWGTKVTVGDAYGIRLHLTGVDLPPGTRFWSYGTEGKPIEFGLEIRGPEGDLWTPIVFGETAFLDVEIPSADAPGRFSIPEIAEIRPLAAAATEPPCAIDAACVSSTEFPAIEQARKAVALLQFMIGHEADGCTGTLLNDSAQDGTPYLLTAHHCISTQTTVSTLQAFWDYDAPSCGGVAPPLSSLATSTGGTLLATGAASDFTLIQLTSIPSGRSFMGWDSRVSSVPLGATIYRVSHPASYLDFSAGQLPQQFSAAPIVDPGDCFSGPIQEFVYSMPNVGYAYRGSSGSAALLGAGQVVGQLSETCPYVIENCEAPYKLLDGAFSATYPLIARWLDAPSPACVPDPETLCLGSRFEVTAQWSKSDGTSGVGTAVSLTPDSGYFWFFDPSNVEVVTKVVSGCGVNGHYWVFASGLTNIAVTLTYSDLATGTQQIYRTSAGTAFEPIQDTAAFATCP